jgi:hypothetical protein
MLNSELANMTLPSMKSMPFNKTRTYLAGKEKFRNRVDLDTSDIVYATMMMKSPKGQYARYIALEDFEDDDVRRAFDKYKRPFGIASEKVVPRLS